MRPSELADLDSTRTGSSRGDFSWEGRGSRQPIEAAALKQLRALLAARDVEPEDLL